MGISKGVLGVDIGGTKMRIAKSDDLKTFAEPVIVETREITQANLGIALRSLSRHDPDRWALSTMSNTATT